jgi:uncharacterized coiled-coil DUF342 family protein
MGESSYDLIVNDDEMTSAATVILSKATHFELYLAELVTTLEVTLADAVIEGKTAQNMERFVQEVKNLKEEAQSLAEEVQTTVNEFIVAMDEADSYLY